MTYLFAWLGIVAGIVTYRMTNTNVPVMEHVAGVYFSGCALLLHAALSAIRSRKP